MSRLVIVSNRLPVTLQKRAGGYHVAMSPGGLVTALRPIVQRHHGCWIGWTGTEEDADVQAALRSSGEAEGFPLVPVFLSERDRREFYSGFCNEILWPLFHDFQSRCNFEPAYWRRYQEVNSRFSAVVLSATNPDDLIWVHDYHLILQGKLLSGLPGRNRVFYFHHIPFPPLEVFEKLPWRMELLESLLSFRGVGFQNVRDRRNFAACVRRFFPHVRMKKAGRNLLMRDATADTLVGAFPIGIDFSEFAEVAEHEATARRARQIRSSLDGSSIVLGVDRLDYTKGIPERIRAFGSLLARYPGLHGKVTLIQVAVPSRQDVPNYQELKVQLESLVAEINHRFGRSRWKPIRYIYRSLSRAELVAHYRAADVALVTPLKDGMNLVAKEFCASRVDEAGVLILSEFAGAASQLRTGALLVNPYDLLQVASALYKALEMSERDIRRRMRRMRRVVKETGVYRWCQDFLGELVPVGPWRSGTQGIAETMPARATALSLQSMVTAAPGA